jgi:hypothetical protein
MILNNCAIFYAHLDPNRPNTKFSKKSPTWDIQIRTTSKEQRKEWIAAGLRVKDVIPDGDEPPYFSATLRKKCVKADLSPGEPPELVDAELNPIDPRTIGNGSIGNVRIFQYEFSGTNEQTGEPISGLASVLMGVQLIEHVVYTPKPRDESNDFKATGKTRQIIPDAAPAPTAPAGGQPSPAAPTDAFSPRPVAPQAPAVSAAHKF